MAESPLNRISSGTKFSFGLPGHKIDMEAADIALGSKKFMGAQQMCQLD